MKSRTEVVVFLDYHYKGMFDAMSLDLSENNIIDKIITVPANEDKAILLIIVCAFYLESSINRMLWEQYVHSSEDIEAAKTQFKEKEKTSTTDKLKHIIRFLDINDDGFKSKLLESVRNLFHARDSLAHYKDYDLQEVDTRKAYENTDRTVLEMAEDIVDPTIYAELEFERISGHIETVKSFEEKVVIEFYKKLAEK